MNTLGERLKKLREGQTQAWLAKQLGIPATTLSNYENGKSELNFAIIDAITTIFKVNTDWLLFGRGPMTAEDAPDSQQAEMPIQDTIACSRCLRLERRLEMVEEERRGASEKLVEALQANLALLTELGEQRVTNLKLAQQLDTARRMCSEYEAAIKAAGLANPVISEASISESNDYK